MTPRIGISAALLGAENRYNGGRARHRFLTEELGAHVDWVPYAADVETGLGALWETWRLAGQLVESGPGRAAAGGLPTPATLDGYVAKTGPLGPWHTPDGQGGFARWLGAAFPLLPVADEAALEQAEPRARFVERAFARARLRALFAGRWRPGDLVTFHTRHKLQILAHSPAAYRQAGQVVAAAGRRPRGETETDYRRLFMEALASDATRGRNVDVMQRAFRKIGKRLDAGVRDDMLDRIRAYQRGELPFGVPIRLLSNHASGERLPWAAEQTYLHPFPAELLHRLWDIPFDRP